MSSKCSLSNASGGKTFKSKSMGSRKGTNPFGVHLNQSALGGEPGHCAFFLVGDFMFLVAFFVNPSLCTTDEDGGVNARGT